MFYRISGEISKRVQSIDLGITDQKERRIGIHVYNRKCHVEVLPKDSNGSFSEYVDSDGIYYLVRVQITRNDLAFGMETKYKIFKKYDDMFEFANNCVEHHRHIQSQKHVV